MIRAHFTSACALAAALLAASAHARNDARLVALINDWRAAPGDCGGARPAPAPALKNNALLARVRFKAGSFPEYELERVGYDAAQVEVIFARGAPDAAGVMDVIRQPYCRVLSNAAYSDIGVVRQGQEWTIVLARPLLPLRLPEQDSEAVAGWIESPGHCANLMNPAFTEMGAGYGISHAKLPGFVYWTQVFGVRP